MKLFGRKPRDNDAERYHVSACNLFLAHPNTGKAYAFS
jgi:hypothetical protein